MKHFVRKLYPKSWLPRTLFARSLMILIIPVLLIQLTTTYIFFERHWTKMTDRLAFGVAGEIAWVADSIEQSTGPDEVRDISRRAAQYLDLLIGFDEDMVFESQQLEDDRTRRFFVARTLSHALTAQVRRPHTVSVDIAEKWVEIVLKLENGVLQVSVPQRRLFSSSGYVFLLWMIGISIVLLSIAIIFMRNQIRPIRRLAIVAERFGKGRGIPQRFKPEGAREVRQAAQSFLDMHDRIKRQIEQRTAMLSGVSHDLKTPLTRMKLQLAMMEEGEDISALREDLEDMERMLGAYLDFARGDGEEASAVTNVSGMVTGLAAKITGGPDRAVIDVPEKMNVQIRPLAFERALMNVMNNALKYANTLWVEASVDDTHMMIVFDDDGTGIPEASREQVFKPFYREEPSRNPETGGVGLGLSIAQDVILSHGGTITLDDSPKGGLRVVIVVPL